MATALALPDSSAIEQAFGLVVPAPSLKDERERLDNLVAASKTLLPVEELAENRLRREIHELNGVLQRSKFAEPMLPLEPLGWRWKNGMPKLALLDLKSPYFTITAKSGREGVVWAFNPALPTPVAKMYDDVVRKASNECVRRGSSCSYSYTFDGVIPASVRGSIAAAMKSYRFESLHMLVETPEEAWKIEVTKGISRKQQMAEWTANLDPLILGWAEGCLWVIDKFDLTTLEDYVLEEFAQKALPSG